MLTRTQILEKLRSTKASMEMFHGKSQAETDLAKREAYINAFNEASIEAKSLQTQLQQVNQLDSINSDIQTLEEGEEADVQGKSLPGQQTRTPSSAGKFAHKADEIMAKSIEVVTNEAKDEYVRRDYFFKYMQGKSLDETGRNMLSPESRGRRMNEEAADAIMLPRSVVYNMFPEVQFSGKADFMANPLGKAMLSVDTIGGATDSGTAFTIAPDFRTQLQEQPVHMPMIIDKVQMAPAVNGKAVWPKLDQGQGNFGGVAFTWKAPADEGADKGETEPTFGEFEVDTYELSGWTAMSLRALRRSTVSLESYLTMLFRNATRYEWSKQIINGTGTNMPKGLVGTTGTADVARLTANQVVYKDLLNLEFALSKGNRAGASYIIEDSVEKYLFGQLDGENRPLFVDGVNSGRRDRINTYAYETHEFGPELGTEGDVLFGNFKNYIFAMEEDIAIAKSEHAEFKKGLVVFRMICYVGGKCLFPGAIARLENAA